jgi:hypothetical protein
MAYSPYWHPLGTKTSRFTRSASKKPIPQGIVCYPPADHKSFDDGFSASISRGVIDGTSR